MVNIFPLCLNFTHICKNFFYRPRLAIIFIAMKITELEKGRLISLNEKEYGENYHRIPFIPADDIAPRIKQRAELIGGMKNKIRFGHKNTKLDVSELSPGCRLCGEGSWSCLFINGQCNCRCFYCPTAQNNEDLPTTSTLEFPGPKDYIDYIEKFGFEGISLSGGEPLLTFEKTMHFLSALKEHFGNEKYIWLYTNGALLDAEKVGRLKNAGLNEIRFDLSARAYKLDKIKLAVGRIENVTVEIPAIPEDLEILKKLVRELEKIGVNYLNLHQLRLTPFNFKNLVSRDYTFLHGKKVAVLDSELVALEIIRYTKEHDIRLPVNYCSFVYKNRFQGAAARLRLAPHIMEKYESITENGFVRRLKLKLTEREFAAFAGKLAGSGFEEGLYKLLPGSHEILFHPDVLRDIRMENAEIEVSYSYIKLLPAVSYRHPFREIRLNDRRRVTLERIDSGERIMLSADEFIDYFNIFLRNGKGFSELENIPKWNRLASFEWIEEGLQEYF